MAKGYLIHYASPYYDPVKAHEYYEQHKKLKGRGVTLNDEGNAAKEYVTKRLKEERDTKISNSKTTIRNLESQKRSRDQQREIHKQQMQNGIDRLKKDLESMSPEDRTKYKADIQEKISALREANAAQREKLSEEYSIAVKGHRADHKSRTEAARQDYTKKLENEMGKIYDDDSLVKSRTGSGKSAGSVQEQIAAKRKEYEDSLKKTKKK